MENKKGKGENEPEKAFYVRPFFLMLMQAMLNHVLLL